MGIRSKLVLCLLAVLLPILAVGLLATYLLDRQLTERTATALANAQRLEAARINQVLNTYANDARHLAASNHVKEFVSATNEYRIARAATSNAETPAKLPVIGGYDNFALVDPDASWPLQQLTLELQRKAGILGTAVVQVKLVDRQGLTLGESIGFTWNPVDEELVERSMRLVKTIFGDAYRNESGQETLGIVSPIISNSGEVTGALMMESRLEPITDLVSMHEGIGYSSEAHLVQKTADGSAQFITPLRFDRQAAFNKELPATANKPGNQALVESQGKVVNGLDYRGVESVLAIQSIPDTGWGLVVKIDTDEAYEPVHEMRNMLKIATFASMIFVLLINLFCLLPIAKRLKNAATTAKLISNGHLDARIDDDSNDEISGVASAMNLLARDLEQDQRKRSEIEARLRHQALHDDLTGILNRKHANKVISELNSDPGKCHSILFLDLNGFKGVNDLYGHNTGDEVLKTVAHRLAAVVPEGGILARWGGDEFVIILPEVDEQQATEFGVQLHNTFDAPVESSEGTHRITCSIGLASSSETRNLQDALAEADSLMYEQKKRLRFQRSKSGMVARNVERALNEDRMEVWYQPIVKIVQPGNYQMIGADTHARIRSNDGSYLTSEEFTHEVDGQALCGELDFRLFTLSFKALRRWKTAGIVDENFALSVKPFEKSFNDPVFPSLLCSQLQSYSIDPSQLILELPSSMKSVHQDVIQQLVSMNISLALNGVNLAPEVLKHLKGIEPAMAIIGAPWLDDNIVMPHLVSICQEMNINIMARNIDTREQLCMLHELGVKQFQGCVFEQPVRAVDFVSRWGQTRLTGLSQNFVKNVGLRLAS